MNKTVKKPARSITADQIRIGDRVTIQQWWYRHPCNGWVATMTITKVAKKNDIVTLTYSGFISEQRKVTDYTFDVPSDLKVKLKHRPRRNRNA